MTTSGPQPLPIIPPANTLVPSYKALLASRTTIRNAIAENITPSNATFQNAIKPLLDADNVLDSRQQIAASLIYASPDADARAASDQVRALLQEDHAAFTARDDFYRIFKAVKDKGEDLDFESQKALDDLLQDYTRYGHGKLSLEQIKECLDRRNAIDDLKNTFNRNIKEEKGVVCFSRDELDGLSDEDISSFPSSTDPGNEHLKAVSFTRADREKVSMFAKNPATRKTMYVANEKKLPQNIDLFKQVIQLRDENARMLGHVSHAAFRLQKRVAKTTEWVDGFLDGLEKTLVPQGEREMRSLLETKKKYDAENTNYSHVDPDMLRLWDIPFYRRIAIEGLHVDNDKISEYFPLQSTMAAMLDVFTSCLQLRFTRIPPADLVGSTWHDDVEAWSVWDEREASAGEFIGYLYADLLWRPNKYQGSQNVNFGGSYLKEDGTRIYPASVLMCGFPRPTASKCALLKHKELVTLFHELGHGIHDLLSRTKYVVFHSHRAPPDFAEAPSMMLENWCWMKDELSKMSCHYTKLDPGYLVKWREQNPGEVVPGEKIPEEMLHALVESRNAYKGLWCLHQLAYSRFDMSVHSPRTHDECMNLDPATIYNTFMQTLRFCPIPDLGCSDQGFAYADFGHILSGYDAGYYSYLCAMVFAQDLFHTIFADNPRDKIAWEKYRTGVLEYGGSRDELQMLKEILGHEPDSKYLLMGLDLADD